MTSCSGSSPAAYTLAAIVVMYTDGSSVKNAFVVTARTLCPL